MILNIYNKYIIVFKKIINYKMLRLLSLFLMVSLYKGDLISFEGDAAVI